MTTRVPVERRFIRGHSACLHARASRRFRNGGERRLLDERPRGPRAGERASERVCAASGRERARELARRGTSAGERFESVYGDFRGPPRGSDSTVALTLSCGVHSRCRRV